jgi:ParB-like chromosome segregation protein Spo0J
MSGPLEGWLYFRSHMKHFEQVIQEFNVLMNDIAAMPKDEFILTANSIKEMLYQHSPFYGNPVDCVIWVKNETVRANDYNPNTVASPEMKLLEVSITEDGYTQPIVTFPEDNGLTVIDGFHRNRVGKESKTVREMVHGYLPVVRIKQEKQGKDTRIASTIRHNRARGKHKVDAMSDIVLELKNRNWTNARISKELGMEEDEILRLCQITGLANLFSDEEFSRSWDIEGSKAEDIEFEQIDDSDVDRDAEGVVTQNTSDPNRVFHTYDKWECHKAGFYATKKDGMTKGDCEQFYADFLSDLPRFERALSGVITEWVNSCEHYLTNASMNRIAWLGQAAVCYESGIPSQFCSGFNLLTEEQQNSANLMALKYLNKWLVSRGMAEVDLQDAMTVRTSTLY